MISFIKCLRTLIIATEKINYIIVGDSTRSFGYANGIHDYYRTQLAAFNITAVLSATSGINSEEWKTNVSGVGIAKLSYAVAQSLGTDGEDTILEFSLGINDHGDFGAANVKGKLKAAIQEYLSFKPKATVILFSPPATGTIERTYELLNAYQELSEELGLVLVNCVEATINVFTGSPNAYYTDGTHPNTNGARRLMNYGFDKIIPPSLMWCCSTPEYDSIDAETALVEQAVVETGTYQNDGNPLANSAWRRLDEVSVSPRALMRLKHQGGRRDIIWKTAANVHTMVILPEPLVGQPQEWLLIVPDDAVTIKVNIETVNATAYDALNDVPQLHKVAPLLTYNMPVSKINIGLNLRMKVEA